MQLTRREWHRLALAGVISVVPRAPHRVAAQAREARYRGVILGVQSYSFRDMPLDDAIKAMSSLGLRSCELWQGHVEPKDVPRAELRRWRETVPMREFRAIRDRFNDTGIKLMSYDYSFKNHFSDVEISRGFEMANALDVEYLNASADMKVVSRVSPLALRNDMRVAMHNHSRIAPDEFATPQNFYDAMQAGSKIAITLDIGHFTAANFDALDFLRREHDKILGLHIKDRKRDQGATVRWGEGDAPIGPVLRLLRDKQWRIPANIEYEYEGGDTVEEVKRCLEYCRRQLDLSGDQGDQGD